PRVVQCGGVESPSARCRFGSLGGNGGGRLHVCRYCSASANSCRRCDWRAHCHRSSSCRSRFLSRHSSHNNSRCCGTPTLRCIRLRRQEVHDRRHVSRRVSTQDQGVLLRSGRLLTHDSPRTDWRALTISSVSILKPMVSRCPARPICENRLPRTSTSAPNLMWDSGSSATHSR